MNVGRCRDKHLCIHTVYLTATTIYLAVCFVQLLFESGIYFLETSMTAK